MQVKTVNTIFINIRVTSLEKKTYELVKQTNDATDWTRRTLNRYRPSNHTPHNEDGGVSFICILICL